MADQDKTPQKAKAVADIYAVGPHLPVQPADPMRAIGHAERLGAEPGWLGEEAGEFARKPLHTAADLAAGIGAGYKTLPGIVNAAKWVYAKHAATSLRAALAARQAALEADAAATMGPAWPGILAGAEVGSEGGPGGMAVGGALGGALDVTGIGAKIDRWLEAMAPILSPENADIADTLSDSDVPDLSENALRRIVRERGATSSVAPHEAPTLGWPLHPSEALREPTTGMISPEAIRKQMLDEIAEALEKYGVRIGHVGQVFRW